MRSSLVAFGLLSLLPVRALGYESQCRSSDSGDRGTDAVVEASVCAPGDGGGFPAECDAGLAFARGKQIGEHTLIARYGMARAGLGAFERTFTEGLFTYYVNGVRVPGTMVQSLAPSSLTTAVRRAQREFSIPEFAQAPDGSYSVADFLLANEHCLAENAILLDGNQTPTPEYNAMKIDRCHTFASHMGQVNSNHFAPQNRAMYELYHGIALQIAQRCKRMYDAFAPGTNHPNRAIGERAALRCEREALSFQAAGAHFQGDAWSSGHMWQRWGSPLYAPTPGGQLRAQLVGLISGLIHGWRGVARSKRFINLLQDDRMTMPGPFRANDPNEQISAWSYLGSTVQVPFRVADVREDAELHPGGGDGYLLPCTVRGNPTEAGKHVEFEPWAVVGGSKMTVQASKMIDCVARGFREVYDLGPKTAGELPPLQSAIASSTGDECWGQRVTNNTLKLGAGINNVLDLTYPQLITRARPVLLQEGLDRAQGLAEVNVSPAELQSIDLKLRRELGVIMMTIALEAASAPNATNAADLEDERLRSLLRSDRNAAGVSLITGDAVGYLERRNVSMWRADLGAGCSTDEACRTSDPHSYCDLDTRRCVPIEAAVLRAFRDGELPYWCGHDTAADFAAARMNCRNSGGGDACDACAELLLPHMRKSCASDASRPPDTRSLCDVLKDAGLVPEDLEATSIYPPPAAESVVVNLTAARSLCLLDRPLVLGTGDSCPQGMHCCIPSPSMCIDRSQDRTTCAPPSCTGTWLGEVDGRFSETWTFSEPDLTLTVVDHTLGVTCNGTYMNPTMGCGFTVRCPPDALNPVGHTSQGGCTITGGMITCPYQFTLDDGGMGNSTFMGSRQ
jgi:hypothetical protein